MAHRWNKTKKKTVLRIRLGRDQGRSRCLVALSKRWKLALISRSVSSHRRAGNKTQNSSGDDFKDPYQSSAGFLMHGATFAYGKTGHYTNLWTRARLYNQDYVEQLNERLCDEFAATLGVNRFNAVEMVNVCSMADAINGYVANLVANSGNLSRLAEMTMEIPFKR
jgi:hypothetical protein